MKRLTQSEWKAQRVHVEEPRLCAVFINTEHAQVRRKVYRYSDGLRPLQDGSYEILYNGTKTGKNDEHLLEAIENHYPFKIYMRKKSDSFKYVGLSTDVSIYKHRGEDQHLVIRLIIRNLVNDVVPQFIHGFARYKADALVHAGVLDRERNWRLQMNTKNLFNGFFTSV